MDLNSGVWRRSFLHVLATLCLWAGPGTGFASILVLPSGEVRANPGKGLAFNVMVDADYLNQSTYPWSGGELLGLEFSVDWDSSQWKISQGSLDACGRSFSEADPLCAYTVANPGGGFDRAVNFRFIAGYSTQSGAAGPIPLAASGGVISFRPPLEGFVVSSQKNGGVAVEISLYELVVLRADRVTVDICNASTDWCGFPSDSSQPLPRSARIFIVPTS